MSLMKLTLKSHSIWNTVSPFLAPSKAHSLWTVGISGMSKTISLRKHQFLMASKTSRKLQWPEDLGYAMIGDFLYSVLTSDLKIITLHLPRRTMVQGIQLQTCRLQHRNQLSLLNFLFRIFACFNK